VVRDRRHNGSATSILSGKQAQRRVKMTAASFCATALSARSGGHVWVGTAFHSLDPRGGVG